MNAEQMTLIRKLASTGKPVIVVLFNGRPLAIPELHELAAPAGVGHRHGYMDAVFPLLDFPACVGIKDERVRENIVIAKIS